MSDLISRQDAIDALGEEPKVRDISEYDYATDYEYDLATREQWKYDVACIEEVPSAQPERKKGEWIPCSEELPKKDGRYQVTRHDYVTNTEFTDALWYEKNLWWNRCSTGDYAVTAWMPLPKPYERKEE